MMDDLHLSSGFTSAAYEAASAFRPIMKAMAEPGRIEKIHTNLPQMDLSVSARVVLLTLCDPETPVYLAPSCDTQSLQQWLSFHTGAPIVTADKCSFALGKWDELQPLEKFRQGTIEYPDRSATLIVETPILEPKGATLRGPGNRDQVELSLPETAAFQRNAGAFPLGLDFIFTCRDRLAALPRSTEVI